MQSNAPIGICDSGVGGISVLVTAQHILPKENYIYYADTAYAPYGTQNVEAVIHHTRRVADTLIQQGIKALIVACNTATSAAIHLLRSELNIPVIGMEPALKPAVAQFPNQKIIVLATPLTLKNTKFKNLLMSFEAMANIIPIPAPKLVEIVETAQIADLNTRHYLERILAHHHDAAAVVLGCTHFIFVRSLLEEILPHSTLIDGNLGTVYQLERVLMAQSLINSHGGAVQFQSSSTDEAIRLLQELYHYGLANLKLL